MISIGNLSTLHQACDLPETDVSVVSEFPHIIASTLPKGLSKQNTTLATDKGATNQDTNIDETSHHAHIITLGIDFSPHFEWPAELEKPKDDESGIAMDMLHKALIIEACNDVLIQNSEALSIFQKWIKRVKRITLREIIHAAILVVVEVAFLTLIVKISGKEDIRRPERTEGGDDEITLAELWKFVGFNLPFSQTKDVKDS